MDCENDCSECEKCNVDICWVFLRKSKEGLYVCLDCFKMEKK
jgi:hypothetical protein